MRGLVVGELRRAGQRQLSGRVEAGEVRRRRVDTGNENTVLPKRQEYQDQQFQDEQHAAIGDDPVAGQPIGAPQQVERAGLHPPTLHPARLRKGFSSAGMDDAMVAAGVVDQALGHRRRPPPRPRRR